MRTDEEIRMDDRPGRARRDISAAGPVLMAIVFDLHPRYGFSADTGATPATTKPHSSGARA
jgi:hypothetical protein